MGYFRRMFNVDVLLFYMIFTALLVMLGYLWGYKQCGRDVDFNYSQREQNLERDIVEFEIEKTAWRKKHDG